MAAQTGGGAGMSRARPDRGGMGQGEWGEGGGGAGGPGAETGSAENQVPSGVLAPD